MAYKVSEMKRKKLRRVIKIGEETIEIYNPNQNQREELLTLMVHNYNNDKKEIDLTDTDVMKEVIPMLTNMTLGTDDDKLLKDTLKDPSEELMDVQEELTYIIQEVITRFVRLIDALSHLPKEDIQQIIETNLDKTFIQLVNLDGDDQEK